MHHVPSYLEKPDDTFIPSKVVQPVSELKIDITSLETIDSEWAKSIPSRLLQKLYVVHKKNVTLYRGIDVRPGMIFFFHSIFRVQSECSSRRSKFLCHFRRAHGIPSRLLQTIYVLHVENLSLFSGIIVRPGTKHIILTRSFVCNPCSCGRSAFLVYIDYETNLFLISENFGVIFDTEFHEIANMVMDP